MRHKPYHRAALFALLMFMLSGCVGSSTTPSDGGPPKPGPEVVAPEPRVENGTVIVPDPLAEDTCLSPCRLVLPELAWLDCFTTDIQVLADRDAVRAHVPEHYQIAGPVGNMSAMVGLAALNCQALRMDNLSAASPFTIAFAWASIIIQNETWGDPNGFHTFALEFYTDSPSMGSYLSASGAPWREALFTWDFAVERTVAMLDLSIDGVSWYRVSTAALSPYGQDPTQDLRVHFDADGPRWLDHELVAGQSALASGALQASGGVLGELLFMQTGLATGPGSLAMRDINIYFGYLENSQAMNART